MNNILYKIYFIKQIKAMNLNKLCSKFTFSKILFGQ